MKRLFVDKKVLIVENKLENIAAAKQAHPEADIAENYKEAIKKLQDDFGYEVVLSAFSLNDSDEPEGIKIGEFCLKNDIACTIIANGDFAKANEFRAKYFNREDLVKLVGDEDPVGYMLYPFKDADKADVKTWERAYQWANFKLK